MVAGHQVFLVMKLLEIYCLGFIPMIFYYMNNFIRNFRTKTKYIIIYSLIFYAVVITGERLALIMLLGATLLSAIFFLRFMQIIIIFVFFSIFIFLSYKFNLMFQNRLDLMIEVLSNFIILVGDVYMSLHICYLKSITYQELS